MKFLILLSVVFAISNAIVDTEWETYKKQFKKTYKSIADEETHYTQYKVKRNEILEHNQRFITGKESYYKGINQFTDMTLVEAKRVSMGYGNGLQTSHHKSARKHVPRLSASLPSTVDWRTKGIVTPIKDQGSCGSCWAFSVVGALEGQHAKAAGKLVSLSEQNLVDCTRDEGNYGCGGGWPYDAYEYVVRVAQGLDTEKSYPYKAIDQKCNFTASGIGARATAFAILSPGNESVLQESVAHIGPISVCIAVSDAFMSYSGGVFDDSTCPSNFDYIDHCVLAVGYGTDTKTGKDYWIVKNSWGKTFGEEGYIRMSRNRHNQCAISTLASYPDVYPTRHSYSNY